MENELGTSYEDISGHGTTSVATGENDEKSMDTDVEPIENELGMSYDETSGHGTAGVTTGESGLDMARDEASMHTDVALSLAQIEMR